MAGHATELVTVRLLSAPVRAWDRAEAYYADLMREFALLAIGAAQPGRSRPLAPGLLDLVEDLLRRYSVAVTVPEPERDAAREAGQEFVDAHYVVPPETGAYVAELGRELQRANDLCREGGLMTLSPPEDVRAFQFWYVEEFVRQTSGLAPRRWTGG